MSKETNMRHVWLAGLGVLSRLRESVNRIAGRVPPEVVLDDEPPPFVTTQKVAKRSTHSSASRRAGERETQRRIAGKGR